MPISVRVQERTFNRTSSIAEITDNLKKAIENNLFTSGVFLDFAKAVDTVNHSILLEKLKRYEIRGQPLLFLIYINYIPSSADKISFRIFANDTNIFTSSYKPTDLEILVNQELVKIKEWCDLNKLSRNLKKTNYMIIRSPQKRSNIHLKFTNKDGSSFSFEKNT